MKEEKIISIEDRIPKLKKQRRRKANRRLIFYLSLFFLLIGVIVYLQSPLSHVKTIKVSGNKLVDEKEIVEQSGLDYETNIWKVKLSDVRSLIKENPFVETVKLSRKLPSTITIDIEEYNVIGYIEKGDSFNPLLDNGEEVLFENRYMQGDAPLLVNFTEKDILNSISDQLQELPDNILRLISEVHWTPEGENEYKVQLLMNDGFIVKGSIRNLSERMKVYPSIVTQLDPKEKGIIHLNVGAYFERFSE